MLRVEQVFECSFLYDTTNLNLRLRGFSFQCPVRFSHHKECYLMAEPLAAIANT